MHELRGLYAITPERENAADLLHDAGAVLAGGCRLLQYRDKQSDAAERRARGAALKILCEQAGAALIINDDLVLATSLGAHGVHLGRDDGDLAAARDVLGKGAIIGASCYADFALAKAAAKAGADYVAFGAVFSSPTKPEAASASLDLFRCCRAELAVPACAIGGITINNAQTVLAAGADLLAVITDLFAATDIAARAAAYQSLFKELHHELT